MRSRRLKWGLGLAATLLLVMTGASAQNSAQRNLPDCYTPGAAITVTITTTVQADANSHIVTDNLPSGWTASSPNEGGVVSPGKVRWAIQRPGGATLTYQVTPPAGTSGPANFNGTMLPGVNPPPTVTIAGETSISNCSTPTCFSLTVNNGSAQTAQNCSGGYTNGTNVTITANTAPSGQIFDRWTGDTVASATTSTTTITMNGNKSVTATYKPVTPSCFGLTVNNGSAQTSQNCSGGYTSGTVVTIAANTAPSGQVFDRWTGDTVASATSSTTTITMNGNKTVTATYKPVSSGANTAVRNLPDCYTPGVAITVTITTTVQSEANSHIVTDNLPSGWTASSPNEGGVVSPGKVRWAIQRPGGATLTYQATPPAGTSGASNFNGTMLPGVNPPPTVTIAGETSISNCSTPTCFSLTVNSGSAQTTQNCSGGYTSGTVVTITANSAPSGQVFDRWTGDTVASATSSTTTITMNGNKSVTATYKPVTPSCFALTVNNGSAQTSQNCSGGYTNGTVVTITAGTPPSGQVFDRWTGDAVANATSSTTTITMNSNKTVSATFKNSTASCNSLSFFSQDGTELLPIGNVSVTLSVETGDCDWTISAISSAGTWWYSYLTAGRGSTEFEFSYPPNNSGQSRQVTLTATLTQTGVTRSVTLTQPAQSQSRFVTLDRTVYYGNCWERSGWIQVPGASQVWLVVETSGVESYVDHLYIDGVEYYGGGLETTSAVFGDTIDIDLSSDESTPGYFYIAEVWYEGNATGSPILGGAIFSDFDDDCIDPCTPSSGCGGTTCVKLYESHQVAFEAKSDGSDVSLETDRDIAGIQDPLLITGKAWNLQPFAKFDTPVVVQVPLPEGLDEENALVLFFVDDPEIMSWYRGENITGWLAEAPREVEGEDGKRYLELTVNHGGRLQLVENSILGQEASVIPLTEWILTLAAVAGMLAGLERGWRRLRRLRR